MIVNVFITLEAMEEKKDLCDQSACHLLIKKYNLCKSNSELITLFFLQSFKLQESRENL